MPLTTSTVYTTPALAFYNGPGQVHWTVTVPIGGPAVGFYGDDFGTILLASVAAGGTANFDQADGFYYSSIQPGQATVVGTNEKLGNVTAFTTIANTATETVTAQFAIPANVLYNGAFLKCRYMALCTGVTSTPTLQHKLYFGSAGTTADTAVITGTTTAILANGIVTGEIELIVGAAPGAAVPVVGVGSYALAGAPGQAVVNADLQSANFATNGILYLTLTLKWSAGSASNIAAGQIMTVELL